MRLTLRTMLAYLDDVLDPSDAEQLGKKIQDSEFASGLVHRIRNSMRRLRLGAPKLDGKGMGLDANTVAEYLDSELAADRVPDFEKVCLESDVHLAEVASCHQILTMVLGEPANVDPAVRQRMYRIGAPVVEPPQEQEKNGGAIAAASEPPASAEATQEKKIAPVPPAVPDYLRAGSRRSFWPLAATTAVAFLVAAVVLVMMGPMDSSHPLVQWWGGGAQQPAEGRIVNQVQPAPAPQDVTPEDTPTTDSTPPTPPEPAVANGADSATAVPAEPAVTVDVAPTPIDTVPPADAAAAPAVPGTAGPVGDAPPGPLRPLPGDEPTLVEPGVASDGGAATPPAPQYVGRFISDLQVLARSDTDSWVRLPANTPIVPNDRLLVLPTYRPRVALAAGIQLTFSGASQLQFPPPDERGTPKLAFDFGRAQMIVTNGMVGARVGLELAARRGEVTFTSADSTLALKAWRYLPPGADPESDAAVSVVRLYAIGGPIAWQEGHEEISIAAGEVHTLLGDAPGSTERADAIPDWFTSRAISDLDRRASQELETKLDFERPLTLSLTERVSADQERHVEVRSLAIRCLSYLDNHEPFVRELNDEENRGTYWEAQIDDVRQALARSPQSAAEVRIALEKSRGGDAAGLYRMLWGYSPSQLSSGAAADLVETLNHESTDYRVLAYVNLKRITGGVTLLYRPEQSAARRRSSIQRWRERLAKGEIVYKTPPTPFGP